jgi:hypothetical protein
MLCAANGAWLEWHWPDMNEIKRRRLGHPALIIMESADLTREWLLGNEVGSLTDPTV